MASSSTNKIIQPDEDPYDVLGLEFPVRDDAVITKAYRKLALTYHPDKQKQSATEAEAKAMDIKFHQIQQARAFLLDAELQTSRQAYDRQRASQQARRAHERAQRDKLSEHRKRMRQELAAAEAEATIRKKSSKASSKAPSSSSSSAARREELRRQGQAMREAHAAKQQQEQAEAAEASRKSRQIRLKWSRKRIKESPSEDSIARDFGRKFGLVEDVEMIGHKGNAALVTFRDASSCQPCVDFYQSSNEMRVTYIQEPPSKGDTNKVPTAPAAPSSTSARDYESVAEWQARRAAARAAMTQEESNENEQAGKKATKTPSQATLSMDFLPTFPSTDPSVSCWDQLQTLEEQILTPLVGKEQLQRLKEMQPGLA